jgi:hypothetical protein
MRERERESKVVERERERLDLIVQRRERHERVHVARVQDVRVVLGEGTISTG